MYLVTRLLWHRDTGYIYAAMITGGGLDHPRPPEVLHAWGPLRPPEYADAADRLSRAAVGPARDEQLRNLLGARDARSFMQTHLAECEELAVNRSTERRGRGDRARPLLRTTVERWDGADWVALPEAYPGRWAQWWPWKRRHISR